MIVKNKSIGDLIMEYFKNHPNKDLLHGLVVDWVEEQCLRLYGKKTKRYMERDPKIPSERYID